MPIWLAILPLLLANPPARATDSIELTVSAAASLTDAFTALADAFHAEHPNVTIRINFGGSNLLQRQIETAAGVGVDVFASAGTGPMNALVDGRWVDARSVRYFAGNKIVLVVPAGAATVVHSFVDLSDPRVRRIAIGDPGVPVGSYAHQVLRHLHLTEKISDKLVYALSARQVLDYVARREVEAGIVYSTDAVARKDTVRVAAWAESDAHEPIRYPIAMIHNSPHPEQAIAFVAFCLSPPAQQIFRNHGFIVASGVDARPRAPDSTRNNKPRIAIWTAMRLSLIAGGGALVVVFPLGTALGALLARRRFFGRELLDAVLTLPMILPPTVTGYYLILLLGSQSPMGAWMDDWLGIRIPLTILGAGIASAVISLPLMVKSARAAFESVDRELELASYTLGKSRLMTLWRVTLPLARPGLAAGAVLSFARAIGEFGATFMLAGIIPGKTMTMPSAIFQAFTNHDDRSAQLLVVTLTAFSILVIYVTNRVNMRRAMRIAGAIT